MSIFRNLLFIFIVSVGIGLVVFLNIYNHPDVRPGQVWIDVKNAEDPFEPPDTTFFEVLEIKQGWAKCKVRSQGFTYTDSWKIYYFRLYEKFKDK